LTALRGHLDAAKPHLTALLGDLDTMWPSASMRLEHMLGHESGAREQG
jgi:hypothetical protein